MKTPEEIELAENQIREIQVDYNYRLADFSIGELLKKFVKKGDESNFEDESISGLYVPTYQRDFIWQETMQSKFVESIFMGVPIQPLFAFELDDDGNLELLDGVQRLSSIKSFFDGKLQLSGLEELDLLNGFSFEDLVTARKRKFLNTILKLYIIGQNTDEGVRADIFRRVNEGGDRLVPAEIRKGKFIGNGFYDFILRMSETHEFSRLFSSSKNLDKLRGEKEELVSRFYALSNNYQNFVHSVKGFMDEHIIRSKDDFNAAREIELKTEFVNTLNFVETYFQNGFKKSDTAKSIPRVRFEAIAVGANLALKEKPDLAIKDLSWLDSNEFKKWTTSDAANSKSKVVGRIEFVRDCLLGIINPKTLSYDN